MGEQSSFVDMQRVYVEYTAAKDWLGRLTGRLAFTQSVLRDVSLALPQGMQVVLFGQEGGGKTTLLRVLAGVVAPSQGKVLVNGRPPAQIKDLAAGYISAEESEPLAETVHDILHTFGTTHGITSLPAKLGVVAEAVGLTAHLPLPAQALSTTGRMRLNIARAALSDSPLVLLDDVADQLGVAPTKEILENLFVGRTVVIATRHTTTAEALALPIMILHKGQMVQQGTCNEIADSLACPRVLEAWIEGLRYDILRKLRQHTGVSEVQLLPSSRFSGQKVRITLQSAHYLPAVYDIISHAPLIRVQEVPASLTDILSRLPS